jgi:hypothetical protein
VLCGLLGAASWGFLATAADNKYATVAATVLSSLSVAFSDVVSPPHSILRASCECLIRVPSDTQTHREEFRVWPYDES